MSPGSTPKKTPATADDSEEIPALLARTFSLTSAGLPSRREMQAQIYTDRSWIAAGSFTPEKQQKTIRLRNLYIKQSHLLLTDELLKALSRLCAAYKKIAELGAGPGWLSHWLTHYGVKIRATVDDKSWPDFPQEGYLELVRPMDAVQYVQENPGTQLFILAWPDETRLAARIWQAMEPGSHLLYIGEPAGGVTADQEFFNLVTTHRLNNRAMTELGKAFIAFEDFHDQPWLFKKNHPDHFVPSQ